MFADNPVSQMMLGLETEQELWGQNLYCVQAGDGQWSAPETWEPGENVALVWGAKKQSSSPSKYISRKVLWNDVVVPAVWT